jgi:hypothetical protein
LNKVGGPGTLLISAWGGTTPLDKFDKTMNEQKWIKKSADSTGAMLAPDHPTSINRLAEIIEDSFKTNEKKQFDRIIIFGHAGTLDGINKFNSTGVMLGIPGKKYQGRLQLKDYNYKEVNYKGQKIKNGIELKGLLDDKNASVNLQNALKVALKPKGVFQIASCGYRDQFDFVFGKGAWETALQELANELKVRVAANPGLVGPKALPIYDVSKVPKKLVGWSWIAQFNDFDVPQGGGKPIKREDWVVKDPRP